MTRTFPLGVVLSITQGRLACTIDAFYDFLGYMTGQDLSTIGLMFAAPVARPVILAQYPCLEGIEMPDDVAAGGEEKILEWLRLTAECLDVTEFEVEPIPAGMWQERSVVDDIAYMQSRCVQVIPVVAPGGGPS